MPDLVAAPTSAPATDWPHPELIGVGSPLVDLVLPVGDDFLAAQVGGAKGGMEFRPAEDIAALITAAAATPVHAPGGSAANIAVGCANLGIASAFIGCLGRDDLGAFYAAALTAQRCQPRLVPHPELPTGRVLSLVTPDSERTMRTCLGAAAALDPAHFTADTFRSVRVVMIEGYALHNHALIRAVVAAARAAGCQVALDLAAHEVVTANRTVIAELLAGAVDLVFANQDEAAAWHPGGAQAALEDLAGRARIAVVKLGKDGALIARGGERVQVAAVVAQAIDSTGAGDSWAAGFLSGWLRGLSLPAAGRIGALAGAAAVEVMGAQLARERWLRIKGQLDAWA